MARLNEPPPMSTDSSDILRKKLLRQNRELARANSNLAQKVRLLEQENHQLINQKLEVAGRLLELEQKVERNAAQRVADHALNVRARLEAQLRDCMSLLEDIGQEPPRKRRQAASPDSRKSCKARSPPRKRIVETEKDAEVRATAEGRLPPLYESKTYPYSRQTLSSEQIKALCSEAIDATDSPELGPPPVSRFVDGEANVMILPSPGRSLPSSHTLLSPTTTKSASATSTSSPTVQTTETRPGLGETCGGAQATSQDFTGASGGDVQPQLPEAHRSSSKRKFSPADTPDVKPRPTVSSAPKPRITATIRGDRQNKSLKELASMRREPKEELTPSVEPRRVLAAKSINADMTSPKKVSKPPVDVGRQKPATIKQAPRINDKPKPPNKQATVVSSVLTSPEPKEDIILFKDILPSLDAGPLSPTSPEPTPFSVQTHGTPPPADISAHGETARPSRRARASVSYAEPNLRDKMRRPTKELFDAVAGEGRYKSRSSTSRPDEIPGFDTTSAKQHTLTTQDDKNQASDIPTVSKVLAQPGVCSPTDQKATDRSKNYSREPVPLTKHDDKTRAAEPVTPTRRDTTSNNSLKGRTDDPDPYDFTSTLSGVESSTMAVNSKARQTSRRNSRSTRRLSSVANDAFDFEDEVIKPRLKATASRKRASIAHTSAEMAYLDDEENHNTSGSTEGEVAPRPTTGRRRSMMV